MKQQRKWSSNSTPNVKDLNDLIIANIRLDSLKKAKEYFIIMSSLNTNIIRREKLREQSYDYSPFLFSGKISDSNRCLFNVRVL